MRKKVEGPKHRTDIHQVEKRQHKPDPLKEVTVTWIPVFDNYGDGAENAIDEKKIDAAGGETFKKTRKRIKNAGAENEQVHKQDIGDYNPYKNQWLLTAVSLDRHGTKVTKHPLADAYRQLNCGNSG
jgi:hypothetical protein